MTYLAIFHAGWLVASVLLGFAVGWVAVVHRGRAISARGGQWLAAGAVVVMGLALARLVPGRFGYWLDLGLVMLAIYLVGCAAGSGLRDRIVSRHASAG